MDPKVKLVEAFSGEKKLILRVGIGRYLVVGSRTHVRLERLKVYVKQLLRLQNFTRLMEGQCVVGLMAESWDSIF